MLLSPVDRPKRADFRIQETQTQRGGGKARGGTGIGIACHPLFYWGLRIWRDVGLLRRRTGRCAREHRAGGGGAGSHRTGPDWATFGSTRGVSVGWQGGIALPKPRHPLISLEIYKTRW